MIYGRDLSWCSGRAGSLPDHDEVEGGERPPYSWYTCLRFQFHRYQYENGGDLVQLDLRQALRGVWKMLR
jgi:hypothetical protein